MSGSRPRPPTSSVSSPSSNTDDRAAQPNSANPIDTTMSEPAQRPPPSSSRPPSPNPRNQQPTQTASSIPTNATMSEPRSRRPTHRPHSGSPNPNSLEAQIAAAMQTDASVSGSASRVPTSSSLSAASNPSENPGGPRTTSSIRHNAATSTSSSPQSTTASSRQQQHHQQQQLHTRLSTFPTRALAQVLGPRMRLDGSFASRITTRLLELVVRNRPSREHLVTQYAAPMAVMAVVPGLLGGIPLVGAGLGRWLGTFNLPFSCSSASPWFYFPPSFSYPPF
ncbi:uncharacterized protein EI97DRAFT_437372 [Westerdykella ornata]|uniref:Uncharacterized protein n=1 Tax=Westerdykella ornata TaxID=318751 RepID=A0A6A6J6D4_WESOR|nr:uncharacterized protein EI97DRAFT_437372 [Westerdykella ornata]KAF2271995.1 hypothetical protein EI97DRAFT_437372 [Westerdykella ornata]